MAKRGAESRANDDQIAGTVQTLFPDLTAAQAATYVEHLRLIYGKGAT
jgi:hypothetical protein